MPRKQTMGWLKRNVALLLSILLLVGSSHSVAVGGSSSSRFENRSDSNGLTTSSLVDNKHDNEDDGVNHHLELVPETTPVGVPAVVAASSRGGGGGGGGTKGGVGGGGGRDLDRTALEALDILLKTYDRRSTPTNDQDVPTNVSCQLFVASLSSINTENMDYVTDTYLRQKWSDPRLSHEDIKSPLDLADPNLVKAIWKPEVYFPNAKEANFQFVTVPNVLIRIHPGGEILYILRLRLKFSCMMELSRYPLDTQVCAMQISSFSKTTKELLLEWESDAGQSPSVSVAKDLRMPQFEMQKITINKCHEENHMGNYSCLVAEFHLHRSIGFHLIQSYLPSILIVSISWVSFWMDVDCVPARVTLGVITLLTVSSQVSAVNLASSLSVAGTSVPQTSYVKAIDVWMGVCTAFVFAALVEFTCVNYLWRKMDSISKQQKHQRFEASNRVNQAATDECKEQQHNLMEMHLFDDEQDKLQLAAAAAGTAATVVAPSSAAVVVDIEKSSPAQYCCKSCGKVESPDGSSNCNGISRRQMPLNMVSPPGETAATVGSNKARAVRIDEICRYVFPLGFALFNVLYWVYYRDEKVDDDQ